MVELLRGLPLVVGYGIHGDALAVEDMFSILTGRPIKLAGFIELGSLMAVAGWALPTCNTPSCHALLTGSVLNKQVSRADDLWGRRWRQLPESLRVYAVADIKHGWLVWCITVGCILHDMFPDPDFILFLTRVTQRDFVAEFNAFLQEVLVRTELLMDGFKSAETREAVVGAIRYRKSNGALASTPPSRVMILTDLMSKWANITYGGCRYLR